MPVGTRAKKARIDQESNFEIYEFVKNAILSGDYEIHEIEKKINQDIFPIDFCSPEDGLTLLHYVCANGREDLFELFIANGADILKEDSEKNTALYHAVLGRNFNIVGRMVGFINDEYLKDSSPEYPSAQGYVNKKNQSGWSALQLALAMQELDIAKYLIVQGGDVADTVLHEGLEFNALHLAAGYGNFETVQYLAEKHRAFFDAPDLVASYLFPPLSILCNLEDGQKEAEKSNYEQIVRYLIKESLGEINERLVSELKDAYPDRTHKIDQVILSLGVQGELASIMAELVNGAGPAAAAGPAPEPRNASSVAGKGKSEVVYL